MMRFSKEIKRFILENYRGISNAELTEKINKTFGTDIPVKNIKYYKKNHRLNSGLTGRFEKGNVPKNKGTKGKINVGGNRTSFKKGHIPTNTDFIGTEKVLKDGYIWVKVNNLPNAKKNVNWIQKQRLVYEQYFGPVPDGYLVIFADGNKRNFDPTNLLLATKAEILYLNRNHYISGDKEITESALLLAKMVCRTNELKKGKKKDG